MNDIFSHPYVIVTFKATTDAMQAEASFKNAGVPGRLVPVPSIIKAGCGMCWYSVVKDSDSIEKHISKYNLAIENIYLKTKE